MMRDLLHDLLRWASVPVLMCGHGLHPVPAARRRSDQIRISTFINVISFLGSVSLVIGMCVHARFH